jgi:hypothetical protein
LIDFQQSASPTWLSLAVWLTAAIKLARTPGQSTFLVIDDYGTGGIWMYIYAACAQQIRERFPELTVITESREWMTPEWLIPVIWILHSYDLDAPTGYLAEFARRRGESSGLRLRLDRPAVASIEDEHCQL